MEIVKGIYQVKTPVPGNGPGMLNAYLVKTQKSSLLVDTGWNTPEAFDLLLSQLQHHGVALGDLKYIVITHTHPDHYGLVHRLAGLTAAELVIHAREQAILQLRAENYVQMAEEMARWLHVHGMPGDTHRFFDQATLSSLGMVPADMPVQEVQGGEHLHLADFDFEILWTPGHSQGHLCLYEESKRLLISGDHILPDTTPNVSMVLESMDNPLKAYRESLARVRNLNVDRILPSHGEAFTGLSARVDDILKHHEERLEAILAYLGDGEATARQVAEAIPWIDGQVSWSSLSSFSRRMALTETISHLELLREQNLLKRVFHEDLYWYTRAFR